MFLSIILFFQCDENEAIKEDIFQEDYFVITDSTASYELGVRLIDGIQFLEHVYNTDKYSATKTVIGYDILTNSIMQSEDLGHTFNEVFVQDSVSWDKCFTTKKNRHLLWESNDSFIWVFDKNWTLIKKINNGDLPWHGTWSIDENDDVIMYAEYGLNVERIDVWRSTDGGINWESVFWQYGKGSNQPQIQHFHTLQFDPYQSNTWYLSSGDDPDHCKIWKSCDNGDTWLDVTDNNPSGTDGLDVHRYTAINFDKNYLYWGTDDNLGNKAQFVRATRNEPLDVELVDSLDNFIRAMVETSHGYLFISEMKIHDEYGLCDFNIFITADNMKCTEVYRFSNPDGVATGFCYSKASKKAYQDIFFCYNTGRLIFPGQTGIIQWQLKK